MALARELLRFVDGEVFNVAGSLFFYSVRPVTVQFVGFFWTFTMKLNELVSQMELAKHYQDGLLAPGKLGLVSSIPLPVPLYPRHPYLV